MSHICCFEYWPGLFSMELQLAYPEYTPLFGNEPPIYSKRSFYVQIKLGFHTEYADITVSLIKDNANHGKY